MALGAQALVRVKGTVSDAKARLPRAHRHAVPGAAAGRTPSGAFSRDLRARGIDARDALAARPLGRVKLQRCAIP